MNRERKCRMPGCGAVIVSEIQPGVSTELFAIQAHMHTAHQMHLNLTAAADLRATWDEEAEKEEEATEGGDDGG